MWETCVSRCYYAAYHLVAALLEGKGGYAPQRWSHEQLAESFREGVAKGLGFSSRDVDLLATLSRERSAADYEHAGFNRERAEAAVATARDLCDPLLRHLADS